MLICLNLNLLNSKIYGISASVAICDRLFPFLAKIAFRSPEKAYIFNELKALPNIKGLCHGIYLFESII